MQTNNATCTVNGTVVDITTFPRQVDRSKGDGSTTCLMHRCWEWTMENVVPHMRKCSICGGICDDRIAAHFLCVARQHLNLPTPQIDGTPKCSCSLCAAKVKAGAK